MMMMRMMMMMIMRRRSCYEQGNIEGGSRAKKPPPERFGRWRFLEVGPEVRRYLDLTVTYKASPPAV